MDVVLILEKLQALGFIRLNKPINKYYSIYCPIHNDGNERKPSCGVLLQDEYRNGRRYVQGWTHCFTCGYAKTMPEFISDLLKMHSISKSGMDWLKENIPGFEAEAQFDYLIPKDLMQSLDNTFAIDYIQQHTNQQTTYVSEEELATYRYTVPYMYERKLTDAAIDKYDVGVDMNWVPPGRKRKVPCITFPVRDKSGQTLFICRRSIQGKLFALPTDISKPVYGLYELSPNAKSVIICESCINAITATIYGYDAVALLGTGTPYQMQQLRELGVSDFVICTDGDEAGKKAANRIKRSLSSVAMIWTVPMPDGKDLNDLTKEEFDRLYMKRE